MSQQEHVAYHECVIDLPNDVGASSSTPQRGNHEIINDLNTDEYAPNAHSPLSRSTSITTSISNSGNPSGRGRGDSPMQRRSPLNSGLWISIELILNLCQIVAAVVVLVLSRHERPQAPLFGWVIGYTVGCIATLPHLFWRYIHRNPPAFGQELEQSHRNLSQNSLTDGDAYSAVPSAQAESENYPNSQSVTLNAILDSPRAHVIVDHFKMVLDCFFAVWFVLGNVWIFGGHANAAGAPNLYRLCIVFLTFSCIGYALPFILCAMICCCLPCIISAMGVQEDVNQNRGASTESINALPSYKYKAKPCSGEEGQCDGGILAAGTDKERTISAEDAICCVCLCKYADGDELRELPCAHSFHKDCIDTWLKINAMCPLCKADVTNLVSHSGLTSSRRHSDTRVGTDA